MTQSVGAADCIYRKYSLGSMHVSNPGTGDTVTWRKDSLGNMISSDGFVCRTDMLGSRRCDGKGMPLAVLQTK